MPPILETQYSRVFLIEDGAAPQNVPEYLGFAAAQANTWKQGTLTPIRVPSKTQYGQFDIIDIIQGPADLPAMSIETRMAPVLSELLAFVKKGCIADIQVHVGLCQNPQDFNGGWDFIRVLESALPSDYGTSNLGALDADQKAPVTETIPFSGQNLYDIKHIRPAEVAASAVTDIVNRMLICDSKTCGACGISSDGCQIMFAITGPVTGSPGLPSEILYSQDGGHTWTATHIPAMALTSEAVDAACVGTNLVVLVPAENAYYYAPIHDILIAGETWTKVTTGFVSTKTPQRIFSLGATQTWIAANGGYIYFTDDVPSGVEVQTDGSVTTQNLTGIHAFDNLNIVAVGANNVVLNTTNGGSTWTLITGPSVGVALNTVYMQSASRWFIGDAGGALNYTLNSGYSWVSKSFPGSGTGSVRDIQFSTKAVGYMAHDTAVTRGRVLRTIDGGHSWVVLPDQTGIPVPTTLSIRTVAACIDNCNVVVAGGTAVGGTDGYIGLYE